LVERVPKAFGQLRDKKSFLAFDLSWHFVFAFRELRQVLAAIELERRPPPSAELLGRRIFESHPRPSGGARPVDRIFRRLRFEGARAIAPRFDNLSVIVSVVDTHDSPRFRPGRLSIHRNKTR
jgi:hypothetical protein